MKGKGKGWYSEGQSMSDSSVDVYSGQERECWLLVWESFGERTVMCVCVLAALPMSAVCSRQRYLGNSPHHDLLCYLCT